MHALGSKVSGDFHKNIISNVHKKQKMLPKNNDYYDITKRHSKMIAIETPFCRIYRNLLGLSSTSTCVDYVPS